MPFVTVMHYRRLGFDSRDLEIDWGRRRDLDLDL
jgi:hypothetical protein